ncbi:MAG TPA: class I SAM-dependent methyltransferase [Anaerovoracaceae bacterium]|nr:class I SAM-dependent methyltransferase [Anaerovoracaceae bacterium]
MEHERHNLFDRIAGLYGLFFEFQTNKYGKLFDKIYNELDLFLYRDAIDFGCGTGALCSELSRRGFRVTGVDSSNEMLKVAKKKLIGGSVNLVSANIVQGVPFENKSFDVSVASFVAHGLQPGDRKALYGEMQRVTKHMILIYDYNEKRSVLTNIAERLEGGDYFNFIKNIKTELDGCFDNLRVIDLGNHASCYVIKL